MFAEEREPVVVERDQPGRPYRGKVFAAVHAHVTDVPYYGAGLCAKLMREGYTGYLIRTTNDEKRGEGGPAVNIRDNEEQHLRMAASLGFKDVFDLYYQDHEMDAISSLELRGRLILIFRLLKVDTVISFNPWASWDENPDHRVTGRVVQEASWMCAMRNDFPEHAEAGIEPHRVSACYYFCARPGQPFNRVVDISSCIENKIAAIAECKSYGGGSEGSRLRSRLAKQGRRLPLLGQDDRTADREYIRQFLLEQYREYGRPHGLPFAERFYYVDRSHTSRSNVEEYVDRHALPIP